jgi:hypothetical protein
MKRNTSLPWFAVVALGVAALAGAPAAASPASDYPEDQLRFETVAAFRYDGDQPVDLYAVLVDDVGAPVEGATVTVQVSTSPSAQVRTLQLDEKGSGIYVACDAVYPDTARGASLFEFTGTLGRMHPAQAKTGSKPGNLCGAGEPQLHIASVRAAKADGKNQPLSVQVDLVDGAGNPVTGASVHVRATDYREHVDLYLPDAGGGRYFACNAGTFDTSGPGLIELMVYATAKGYRSDTAWTQNQVGYLCTTTVQQPTTARRER